MPGVTRHNARFGMADDPANHQYAWLEAVILRQLFEAARVVVDDRSRGNLARKRGIPKPSAGDGTGDGRGSGHDHFIDLGAQCFNCGIQIEQVLVSFICALAALF